MSSKTNNAGRMTSISKKINASFVGKLILNTVKLDLLIFIVVLFLGGYFAERYTTGEFKINRERRLEDNQEGGIDYIIIDKKSGEEFCVNFTDREQFVFNGFFAVLILLQAVSVIRYACTNQNDINRKLKPLYDLAKKTEEISDLAYDEQYFKSLEDAISNVNADMPDAHISTQNKELKGIEIALNNLLDRMRESYRQQTRFVSDASHELRTPIAVIRGYADMLDRWGKEDESILLESIEAIKNESANMQKLVEQLLFLARGDSGRNNLKIERINLAVLLREVYEESKMIDEKHYFDFQAEDAIMKGDVAMVKQSARIFVDNATKYTTPGDTISIRTGKNENGVFFQIQDNGIGMKESDVVHVFERFYRSDEARNRKSGGTGLGLSIAKWIVDRHGGRINVLSRPEIGTRITVYFEEDKSFDHVENV